MFILVLLLIILVIHVALLAFVCIDQEFENFESRYARKTIITGKMLANESTCRKELPQCIIIGVMKGGTEAFSTFFALHPQVAMQFKMKATLFFTDINYEKGLDWYKKQMPCSTLGQTTIEKSPQYWESRDAPEKIKKYNSNVKLILIVRDPIARAMSHYLQQNKTHQDTIAGKTFEESITNTHGRIDKHNHFILASSYSITFKHWLKYFKNEQILVIDGDNFHNNVVYELNRAEKFLNLSSYISKDMFLYNTQRNIYCIKSKCGNELCLPRGKGRPHPNIDTKVFRKLRKYFEPLNSAFSKLAGQLFNW